MKQDDQHQASASIACRAEAEIGRTGLKVNRLGLGGAPLAGLYQGVTDEDAARVVNAYLGHGLGFFDTAPLYGSGVSETRLGDRAFKPRPRSQHPRARILRHRHQGRAPPRARPGARPGRLVRRSPAHWPRLRLQLRRHAALPGGKPRPALGSTGSISSTFMIRTITTKKRWRAVTGRWSGFAMKGSSGRSGSA